MVLHPVLIPLCFMQVIPSDGKISVSLWDLVDANAEALKAWLVENLGSECSHEVQIFL